MDFDQRSQRSQVARLRPLALQALAAYPLEVRGLRLLHHGFNTTFRVDTAGGERYALRLHVNSRRTRGQIGAEMAWLAALARDTDLVLPVPQPRRDGALFGQVWSEDLGRELPAALFSWLPGRNLGDRATPAQLRAVGQAAATLHAHARRWSLPPGTGLITLDTPLMDSPNTLAAEHPLLTPECREVIGLVWTRVTDTLGRLFQADTPRPLHADLHAWNLKWHRGQLAVFDFDDSGIGVPVQDLAIAAYYLRPRAELEEALLSGYAGVAALPPCSPPDFESLIAGRNLVLLNDLFSTTTAEIRALLPRYLPNTVTKLRHFLESGTYRHDLPGLLE